MEAAFAKARESMPAFWARFQDPKPGDSDFSVKVRLKGGDHVEYFWLTDLTRGEGSVRGSLNNEPVHVTTVKLGETITVPDAEIVDWLYMRNRKMHGNFTLRPLLSRMSPEEAAQMRSLMAEP